MPDTGWLYPQVGTEASRSGANKAWTSEHNIKIDNAFFAFTGNMSSSSDYSHWLVAEDFGIYLPSSATVNGIEWKAERWTTDAASTHKDDAIQMRKAGVDEGSSKGGLTFDGTEPPAHTVEYGGSTDVWGGSWIADDIAHENFGVGYSARFVSGTTGTQTRVNYIQLKVTYTESDTNLKNAGTCAEVSHGSGTEAWFNESNATGIRDASEANTSSPAGGPHQTHYLQATNFGFAIPTDATIEGIQVRIYRRHSGTTCSDTDVRIVKGGSISSTNRSAGVSWPGWSTPDWQSFGSPSDKWGETWTYSDINASNFGIAVAASIQDSSSARVDAFEITVWYTREGEVEGSASMMQSG